VATTFSVNNANNITFFVARIIRAFKRKKK